MSNLKAHEYKENLNKCYKVVLQSSAKGIRAVEIARKLDIHKTTVHRYLTSLELMGKVEDDRGIWHAKTGEQTIKPLEKEIVIELPMPKSEWRRIAFLEAQAKESERLGLSLLAEDMRITLEKLKETRTIRIKGKNVDDLDLEKLGNLIQQANKKSLKVNLRGL
ncbi:MAG: helix-turn-helix domain-containing protein [Candidatus Bathyarchaeota archaeon]|nr:helix-turn-helix domain-containing protein [Candidatus Bathyarchaeota archaeon]